MPVDCAVVKLEDAFVDNKADVAPVPSGPVEVEIKDAFLNTIADET
jgi:hypothetical protein